MGHKKSSKKATSRSSPAIRRDSKPAAQSRVPKVDTVIVSNPDIAPAHPPLRNAPKINPTRMPLSHAADSINARRIKNKTPKKAFAFDVWGTKDKLIPTDIHSVLCNKQPSFRATLRPKTSSLPAVSLPSTADSYNPTPEAHSFALVEAAIETLKNTRRNKSIANQLRPDPKIVAKYSDKMTIDIPTGDEIESDHDDEKDKQPIKELSNRQKKKLMIDPNFSIKKTQAERNKEKRLKDEERSKRWAETEKRKLQAIDRVDKISDNIETRAKTTEKRIRLRKIMKKKLEAVPKRLGKGRFVETPKNPLLPEELPGSVRNISAHRHLVLDQFRNFQRRNMLEVGTSVRKPHGAKMKKYNKKFD
eukprot:TRINITY_DN8260_c0_g1_i1.p2 TRINITY_DN8260_c0_g1~~TRINITY_DN8260_c0_g1_i1.p2  ORF type:complete len:361 (+),score=167.25 TRINITY_DN8260_c0_g1_i1:16-1098(+)